MSRKSVLDVMADAWAAVDGNGNECVYTDFKPRRMSFYQLWQVGKLTKGRRRDRNGWPIDSVVRGGCRGVPRGTLERLLGVRLTWADEPVRLTKKQLSSLLSECV